MKHILKCNRYKELRGFCVGFMHNSFYHIGRTVRLEMVFF